jgi:DNA-binding MarR family transcriptional regulator
MCLAMPMTDLYRKPGHLIRRCQQIAVAIFVEEVGAAGFDLTPVQYAALVAVRENPGVDQAGLAGLIAFDRSTMGGVVERLEQRGWLRREPGREDRRTKRLFTTPAGDALLHAVEPAVRHAQERMLAPLPPDERPRFVAMLEQMVRLNNELSRAPLRRSGDERENGVAAAVDVVRSRDERA